MNLRLITFLREDIIIIVKRQDFAWKNIGINDKKQILKNVTWN
jgi:hypothetical protein